ncbi:hypothetical protein PPACK8108_LOCUS15866 [Phakopsora pachyrhizi]|uniref:Uncharacterized protein n=1 Tax=Phakopsora pachyrhizi TaxID=170000 RepID=A0AAV0BAF5_PHAPC|nr:hypothetical protein PPACK8108_LOCUS15866 [Phakopsora pachyrhizi]
MRLPRLFEGVALDWFVTKSEIENPHDWKAWKVLIKYHCGTRLWKKNMIKDVQKKTKESIEADASGIPVLVVPQGLDDDQAFKFIQDEKAKAGK